MKGEAAAADSEADAVRRGGRRGSSRSMRRRRGCRAAARVRPREAPASGSRRCSTPNADALHRAQRNPARPGAWPAGLGIARVDTSWCSSEEIRKEIENLRPDEPVRISTRVGFFGGGTTPFKSDGRTIKPKDEARQITYETYKLDIGYSKNLDDYDIEGKWPKLEVNDHGDRRAVRR